MLIFIKITRMSKKIEEKELQSGINIIFACLPLIK